MASSTGAAVVVDAVLPKQHFTGNPLERDSDACKRFTEELKPDSEISLVVVAGREVVVRPVAAGGPTGVHQELQALLLRVDDPELDLQVEEPLLRWTPPGECHSSHCTAPNTWHAEVSQHHVTSCSPREVGARHGVTAWQAAARSLSLCRVTNTTFAHSSCCTSQVP